MTKLPESNGLVMQGIQYSYHIWNESIIIAKNYVQEVK